MSRRICIIGDGAWGTALREVAQSSGNTVRVWSRRHPDGAAVAASEALILAVPAQTVRSVMQQLAVTSHVVIIAAKGIERGTGKLMVDVVQDCARAAVPMVLSGPSFAADVIKGLPTAVTLAATSLDDAAEWAKVLALQTFRIYQTDDVRGVELGGSLKNVLAIACGISDGFGFGESARAALITRGFAELFRLSTKMGARPETLMGLAGLGDLMLTCHSSQSRNHRFGFAMARGATAAGAQAQCGGVVEGAATAAIAAKLADIHTVEMPIVKAVHAIVDGGAAPADMIRDLLARPALTEFKQEL